MRLSKGQKLCAVILALALGALVVDRVFLGYEIASPDQAAAADTRDSRRTPPDPSIASFDPLESTFGQPLTERLEAMATSYGLDPADTRDAFRLSPGWMADCRRKAPTDQHLTPAERFIRDHQLLAVILTPDADSAAIDGNCLFVGEKLDGFELISVSEHSAAFESDGERVVLKLTKRK